MIELAFDTATTACAVSLRVDGGEVLEVRPPAARLLESPAHTTELLPAILSLTERAGIELGQIDRVGVGVGPGAFTGLRIGLATARAIATASGTPLTPFSSLEALADGSRTPVVDARRNEFYLRIAGEDLLLGPEEAAGQIAAAGLVAVGDGALKLRESLEALGAEVARSDDDAHVIGGAAMLRLIATAEQRPVTEVEPNYIRPPDAKVSSRESWLVGPGR